MVLSGGGGTALSHIGVLKALEENNIPIDYIAGTSMGASIAGMYASGYSPEQIEGLVSTEKFQILTQGKIEDQYIYFFKQKEEDASWISIKFLTDSILQTSIPTNIITPTAMDFDLMEGLSGASAAANYNFDSLFIPFRCVAADIQDKKQVIFKSGHLNEAVRASMSYPFYLKPITVNGKLLFDGGLYNNFPTDVMYNEFFPDIIIGSNVSSQVDPPNEDDIISQIKNMLIYRTDYSAICENGIIIEPKSDAGTFDFSNPKETIRAGYEAAMAQMDEIKASIERREDRKLLNERRALFRASQPPIVFDTITIDGLNKKQTLYVRKILQTREDTFSLEDLKPRYFRVFSDDKIKFTYPKAEYKEETGFYTLQMKVKKENNIITNFGGNFSSRPINTGFIELRYNHLGKSGLSVSANSYFGKFYGSAQLKARLDFPVKQPFYIEPVFTLNRWDYFKSFATFFEDVKPSFLVKNEQYAGLNIGMPVRNKGRLTTDIKYAYLNNEYYQTDNFSSIDTADQTKVKVYTAGITYERSTLNRKQYASEGTYLSLRGRYVQGDEESVPGSTAPEADARLVRIFKTQHTWLQFKFEYSNYFKRLGKVEFGFHTEGVYSTQPFFSNYSASILAAPAFQPIPESKTLFQEQFRAHKYAAGGLRTVYNFKKNFDVRLEGYVFQPANTIVRGDSDFKAYYGVEFEQRYYIGTLATVYHSPLGPLSLSLNYYDFNKEDPYSFLIHFGYILFNKKALD